MSYDNLELLGLMLGLLEVDEPDQAATTGPRYYGDRTPYPNFDWFTNPKSAFEGVKHQGWLIEQFFQQDSGLIGDADPHPQFFALTRPPRAIWRFFSNIVQAPKFSQIEDYPGLSDTAKTLFKQSLSTTPEGEDWKRRFASYLILGVTPASSGPSDQDGAAVLGIGCQTLVEIYPATEAFVASDLPSGMLELALEWYAPVTELKKGRLGSPDLISHSGPPSETAPQFQFGLCVWRDRGKAPLRTADPPQGSEHENPTGLRFCGTVDGGSKGHTVEQCDSKGKWTSAAADWWDVASNMVGDTQYNNQPYYKYVSELLASAVNPIRFGSVHLPTRQNVREAWDKLKHRQPSGTTASAPTQEKTLLTLRDYLLALGFLKRRPSETQKKTIDGYSNDDAYTFTLKPLAGSPPASSTETLNDLKFNKVLQQALVVQDGFPIYLGATSGSAPQGQEGTGGKSGESKASPESAIGGESLQPAILLGSSPPVHDDGKTTTYFGLVANAGLFKLGKTGKSDSESDSGVTGSSTESSGSEGTATPGQKRDIGLLAALGSWFTGESAGDNWYSRLQPGDPKPVVGPPGLAVFPIALVEKDDGSIEWRQDWQISAISFGFDAVGLNEKGLLDFDISKLNLRLGAFETRFALALDVGNGSVSGQWAVAAKLDGLGLSFDQGQKKSGLLAKMTQSFLELIDEQSGGGGASKPSQKEQQQHAETLANSAVASLTDYFGATQGNRAAVSAKDLASWKKGFDIEVGFMMELGSHLSLHYDVQLYDSNGARGKVVWIPIGLSLGPLQVKAIGIGMRDVDIGQATLTLAFTGSLSFMNFQLGVIGAGVKLPLYDMASMRGSVGDWLLTSKHTMLQGFDFSFATASVDVEGGLIRHTWGPNQENWEIAGELRVATPAIQMAAMGAFGPTPKTSPPPSVPVAPVSFFLYGYLGGKDIIDIYEVVQINGIALGAGVNRQVAIPPVEGIPDFTLVEIVMGGDDGDPSKLNPLEILLRMTNDVMAVPGWYFAAAGVRFGVVEILDCFALAVVQIAVGKKSADLELALLGVGRLSLPKGPEKFLYVELDIEADLRIEASDNPEVTFRLEADINPSSWIVNKDVSPKFTVGFAAVMWIGGDHSGDFVVSLGGYYPGPAFNRPTYYPSPAPLGFSWSPVDILTLSGDLYFAVTPSCMMAGGRFDASLNIGPVSAGFNMYANFLMRWKPFHYDVTIGLSIHASVDLFLVTLHVTVGATLQLSGPQMHGQARFKAGPVHVSINFGDPPQPPQPVTWSAFGTQFLDSQATAAMFGPVAAEPGHIEGPNLLSVNPVAGLYVVPKGSGVDPGAEPASQDIAAVRADELAVKISIRIPAKTVVMREADADGLEQLQKLKSAGALGTEPVALARSLNTSPLDSGEQHARVTATLIDSESGDSVDALGIQPMDLAAVNPDCRLYVSKADDTGHPVSSYEVVPADWTITPKISSVPRALWSSDAPSAAPEPSAARIQGAIVGFTASPPKTGGPRGLTLPPTGAIEPAILGFFDLPFGVAGQAGQTQPAPTAAAATATAFVASSSAAHATTAAALASLGLGAFQSAAKSFRETLAQPLQATS